jgi:hypothetical protein
VARLGILKLKLSNNSLTVGRGNERRFPPPWFVEACRIIALSQRIMEFNAENGIVGVRLSEFVMTRLASRASTSGRGLLTFIQPQGFELSFSVRALLRLSPPPSTVEELDACFKRTGEAL